MIYIFHQKILNFFGGDIDDECIRIRIQKDKYILCYKKIYMGNDESDIHIVEYETEVSNLEATINILKGVRINKVCDLIKNRDSFIYKNLFEISLDKVKDLGYFVEIEVYDKDIPINEANQLLLNFVKELNLDITRRNLKGYSYLMYDKLNISTKNGNAVVLSEEDYSNLMATLEIESNKKLKEDIVKGMKEEIKDCIDENEVDW